MSLYHKKICHLNLYYDLLYIQRYLYKNRRIYIFLLLIIKNLYLIIKNLYFQKENPFYFYQLLEIYQKNKFSKEI